MGHQKKDSFGGPWIKSNNATNVAEFAFALCANIAYRVTKSTPRTKRYVKYKLPAR